METKGLTVKLLKRGENLIRKSRSKQPPRNEEVCMDTLPIETGLALAKAVGGEEKVEPSSKINREIESSRVKRKLNWFAGHVNWSILGCRRRRKP